MACEVICCEIKGIIDLIVDGFVPTTTTTTDGLQSVVSSDDGDENAEVTLLKDPRPQTILDLSGNAENGKRLFHSDTVQCKNCHRLDADAQPSVGPSLSRLAAKRSNTRW